MTFKQFLPDIRLQNFIKHYWVMEIDEGIHGREDVFFPVGAIEIIFHFGSPLLRLENSNWQMEKTAFVEGQQSGILRVKQNGNTKTVGITFYPWTTIAFFKNEPASFTNLNFKVGEINTTLEHLYQQLSLLNNVDYVPVVCNKYFLTYLGQYEYLDKRPHLQIMNAFKKRTDNFSVRDLKTNWTYSNRLFETKFKELIGTSAGQFIKKKRMNYVLKKIMNEEFRSLTDLSYSAGYYDQSHFIKDFKGYFRTTPKQFQCDYPMLKNFV